MVLTEQHEIIVEIIVDTGPLLQILVGLYDPKKLEKVGITPQEFGLLISFVRRFKKKLVTPQVLAELSNLAKTRHKDNFKELIEVLIRFLVDIEEKYIEKSHVLNAENLKLLQDFGITDTTLALASDKNRIILTNDVSFFQYCYNNQIPVVHTAAVFNAYTSNIITG